MRKVLTALLLLVSIVGISPALGASATGQLARAQATSLTAGTSHSFALQRNRRWRRRAVRRTIRWNRGRTDNTWNRGRWNRRRWDNRRWNRGRTDNTWNRGRRNRGGGHGRH